MRMSVLVLALCLLLGTGSVASAQGGVVIGVNFAKIGFTGLGEEPDTDYRTGLAAGFFLSLPLGGTFTIQPEVLFSQKGTKFSEAGGEATIELDYLDIPILARVASGATGVAFFAGPSFGFKVRARAKGEAGDVEASEDIGDEVESFDPGFIVGAGFQSPRLFVDGRLQWGLSNVNKFDPEITEMKNRVFSILLGFRF